MSAAAGSRAEASERVRDAIVAATVRIAAREGVAAVTHRRLAAEAGVSLSSTTYHFASKDEIVGEALRRVAALEIERVAQGAAELEGHPDIPSFVDALVEWLAEQLRGDGRLVVRAGYHLQLEAAGRPELEEIHLAWGAAVRRLAEHVLELAGARRPQIDATILATAIDGLRLEEITAHDPDFEQRFRAVLERLLRALTA